MVTAHAAEYPAAWPPANTHDYCRCFGARLDVIGTGGASSLVVEVKTGARIQPTHWLQLEAQVRLAMQEGLGAGRGIMLHLKHDGTYTLPKPPSWFGRGTAWDTVLCAARIAQWRLRRDPKAAQLSGDGPHALRRADGVRVPGIGTVLRLAGLVDLRDVPADILAKAAAKGAMVHQYLEWIYDGQGGLAADSIVPELRGYVAAWWRFIVDADFVVERVETPLVFNCTGQ